MQAFHYWLKCPALAVPVAVLLVFVGGDHQPYNRPAPPRFGTDTTVTVKTDVVLQVTQPTPLGATGTIDGAGVDGPLVWEAGRHSVASG